MVNINKLIKQLSDEDEKKREEAILTLAELRDDKAVESLIKVVNQDTIQNRTYAITALSEIGDHRAIETLIFCLMDNEENIRLSAARALGKFSSPQAISALLVSLRKDPSTTVRSRAALSLGSVGSLLAVEDLLEESKLEHPTTLLYSIDSALKMIAQNNGFASVDEMAKSVMEKKGQQEKELTGTDQESEKEQLLRYPKLWPYIRKYVFETLEGIQSILSIESDEKTAEKKIAEILGEKFWKFVQFLERKMNQTFSEYQSHLLWQMVWDTSKPIRSEIFNMIKDHKREIAEINRYRVWLDKIEEEKEAREQIVGEPIIEIPQEKKERKQLTAAEMARSISGDIEGIMKKYSRWKDDVEEQDDFSEFGIETK
ncbi:MAG: HEAT repeat domain-containing protein [Candidatus Heimdallarchaeaceae archaeon]